MQGDFSNEAHGTRSVNAPSLPPRHRRGLSRFFSDKVDDSLRLRLLVLAAFWLTALSVAWVGGSPWTWVGGGVAATFGHAFSWHRRHRTLSIWPMVMAVMVVGLALLMRSALVAALEGNWLPLAHFLLLVQAIASFDLRSRAGLYGGLALSGIVLFFASQQAFDLSFGLFLLGYAGLLMAFLATAFIEDEAGSAQKAPTAGGLPLTGFWSGTAGVVLLLSVLAFLLLPRGESNAVGYQDVAALPITGDPEASQPTAPAAQPRPQGAGQVGEMPSREAEGAEVGSSAAAPAAERRPDIRSQGPDEVAPTLPIGNTDAASNLNTAPGGHVYPVVGVDRDSIVAYVRSPVASYWRARAFDIFDGRTWRRDRTRIPVRETGRSNDSAQRYTQTFYMGDGQSGETLMGYRGVEVLSGVNARSRGSLSNGFSYKVVSVQPELVPADLRKDRVARADTRYYTFPSSMRWLPGLASQVTEGATTDFDAAARIAEYVKRNAQVDDSASDQLRSSASLDAFLSGSEPGTSMDYATATTMLARAAGLPARLVQGYLPGERDPLSGAYKVRRRDAHAWSEIKFREHGWVPFDASPQAGQYVAGSISRSGQVPGLKYLFESSIGDDVLRAMIKAPSRITAGLKDAFGGPISAALAAVAAAGMLVSLAWLAARLVSRRRTRTGRTWAYTKLSGDGRHEMLRIYHRAEKLLRRKHIHPRKPGQTVQVSLHASELVGGVETHLAWFAEAAWEAAYNPSPYPMDSVQAARSRLSALKAALG